MKRNLLNIVICGFLVIGLTGCNNTKEEHNKEEPKEEFMIGNTLDDGRVIHFTFDVPYHDNSLSLALSYNEISIDEFINQLYYISMLNDGGSKLYKYNKNGDVFGNENFHVLVCNSIDNIKDIYVAKHIETLNNKCSIKINDLDGVSMTIKEGTLTKSGATIIITDTSDRENVYGQAYRIDHKDNDKWKPLSPIIDNYSWNLIGYYVGKNNVLEFNINWEWLYGKLESGEYRIVKDTSETGEGTTHYITTEFVIK